MGRQKAERSRRDHSKSKGSEPRRRRYKCAFTTRSTGSTRSGRRYALHEELAKNFKNFKKNRTGQGCSAGRSEAKEQKKAHRDLLLELSRARTVPKHEGSYKQEHKQNGGERCGKEHTPSPEIIKNEDSATQKSGERRKEHTGHNSFNERRREDDTLQKKTGQRGK